MAKSTDFPVSVREWGKALSTFSHRHYDYDIFADFIDYVIGCLLWEGSPETAERLKSKYGDDYPKFNDLYRALMVCMQENLKYDTDWFDVLGTVYEAIASRSKCSWMGQFFTPSHLCDFMAQIVAIDRDADGEPKRDINVNEPACGSGRTVLAFNKYAPGNRIYAEDLDPICVKMTAINMAIHGIKGQVCNMNTLNPSDWRFGYEVNPRIYTTGGIPHLVPITKEQSFTYAHWEARRLEVLHGKKEVVPTYDTSLKRLFIYTENMKGSDQFKEVIKAHLEQRAAQDPLFAKTYAKENKNIDDCIKYILSEVQKSKVNGFADEEIFGMAVHYYDEDDIKPGKVSGGRVVVNHTVAPDAPAPAAAKNKPSKKPAADTGVVQTSLF